MTLYRQVGNERILLADEEEVAVLAERAARKAKRTTARAERDRLEGLRAKVANRRARLDIADALDAGDLTDAEGDELLTEIT